MYKYKSKVEEYFSYYLEELQEAGYIEWWKYESDTFELSDSIEHNYSILSKSDKISTKSEHLMRKASITSDFTIKWLEKAKNVFYLDYTIPITTLVRNIPFRVDDVTKMISQVEIKSDNESTTSSSIAFPYKQKWCYQLYKVYIQKIKPYHALKGLLFEDTFTPKKVIKLEVYKRDGKFGKKGESKIRYNIKTLQEYVKNTTSN